MNLLEMKFNILKAIQKRRDNSTDFNRNWEDYKEGFGDPATNYWIGKISMLHGLFSQKKNKLTCIKLSTI
jgi:hypothetical protein